MSNDGLIELIRRRAVLAHERRQNRGLAGWLRRREDVAWQEGYDTASQQADEVVRLKDSYIAKQEALIRGLMDSLDGAAWDRIDPDLYRRLQDYV